ncbi:hypothetical protein ACFLWB_00795 [Chloroflexota bacterium]
MVIGQDYSLDVERKVISILRVLRESPEPVGGRLIARGLRYTTGLASTTWSL